MTSGLKDKLNDGFAEVKFVGSLETKKVTQKMNSISSDSSTDISLFVKVHSFGDSCPKVIRRTIFKTLKVSMFLMWLGFVP